MELWELLQLPRPDIDKMRKQVDEAVYALEIARRKITERNICMAYPNDVLLKHLKAVLTPLRGEVLRPHHLPDQTLFYVWLCFGSFVEGDSRFRFHKHRDERMRLVSIIAGNASFLQKLTCLERVCEYYDLLLFEVDKRGFYIPAR